MQALAAHGLLPDRVALLAPVALLLSNTIGNVPAVVTDPARSGTGIPEGTLVGLAVLTTLAGNLLLVACPTTPRGACGAQKGRQFGRVHRAARA